MAPKLTAALTVALAAAPLAPAAEAGTRSGDRFFALKRAGVPVCPAREVRARSAVWVSLRCRRLNSVHVRVVKPPIHAGWDA